MLEDEIVSWPFEFDNNRIGWLLSLVNPILTVSTYVLGVLLYVEILQLTGSDL